MSSNPHLTKRTQIQHNIRDVLEIMRVILDVVQHNSDRNFAQIMLSLDVNAITADTTNIEVMSMLKKNIVMFNLMKHSELEI
jgi:hypothetical protein